MFNTWLNFTSGADTINCTGAWVTDNSNECEAAIAALSIPDTASTAAACLSLDGAGITRLDSLGAWLLQQLIAKLALENTTLSLLNFKPEQLDLIEFVKAEVDLDSAQVKSVKHNLLYRVGFGLVNRTRTVMDFINFIGELSLRIANLIKRPVTFRGKAFLNQVEQCGYQALPIIALLSFLIGVVLTYQMGLQLKLYGANIFVVDLLGMSILREFGPLITAIVVIGRTGSAFTAQLGTMKIHQETEALTVIGVPPFDILVLPRVFALMLVLPLLTLWADIFGVLGGMFMADGLLEISFTDFLSRFERVVSQTPLILGLIKAPVFALLISVVGCFRGFRVSGSAQSVGEQTTKSVVQAIFLIVVADAIFSILFSWMGL